MCRHTDSVPHREADSNVGTYVAVRSTDGSRLLTLEMDMTQTQEDTWTVMGDSDAEAVTGRLSDGLRDWGGGLCCSLRWRDRKSCGTDRGECRDRKLHTESDIC